MKFLVNIAAKLGAKLGSFFSKVDNSAPGLIVPEELFRSIVAAFSSGGLIGGSIMLLSLAIPHIAVVFPNPLVAGLATLVLTLILDLLRRQNQGVSTPGQVVVAMSPPIFATMPPGDSLRDPSGNGWNVASQEWQTPRGPDFPTPTMT